MRTRATPRRSRSEKPLWRPRAGPRPSWRGVVRGSSASGLLGRTPPRSRRRRPFLALLQYALRIVVAAGTEAARDRTASARSTIMGHADRLWVKNAILRQELQHALLGTAIKFGDALRRFERRRRQRGFDRSCSRLLDEAHVSET